MPEFPESTLWRISAFERMRDRPDAPAQIGVGSTTMLSTTLLAELRQLRLDPDANDVLETMAACVRNREAALLYLAVAPYVWPVTLFPQQFVYHSPRDVADLSAMTALSKLKVISVEVPGVRTNGLLPTTATGRWHRCSGPSRCTEPAPGCWQRSVATRPTG
jgi:hypothetical protein